MSVINSAPLSAIDKTHPVVSLMPVAGITSDLTERLEEQWTSLRFDDHAKKADELVLVVEDDDGSLLRAENLVFGAVLRVSWGYPGTMAPPRDVIVKKIQANLAQARRRPLREALRGSLYGRGYHLEYTGLGKLVQLHLKSRSGRVWARPDGRPLTPFEIVTEVARDYGYRGSALHLPTFSEQAASVLSRREETWVQRASETDAQFLSRLARTLGLTFSIRDDGLHFHEPESTSTKSEIVRIDLDRDEDLVLGLEVVGDVRIPLPSIVRVRSYDAKTKKVAGVDVSGDASKLSAILLAPMGVRGTTAADAVVNAERAKNVLADETKPRSRSRILAEVHRFEERIRHAWKLKLRMVGDPRLRAGRRMEVVNAAPLIDGVWYVEHVLHQVDPAGGYVVTVDLRPPPRGGSGKIKVSGAQATEEGAAGAILIRTVEG